MVRLYLFAEGRTEQTFADIVLKPHLAQHDVFLNKPVLIAHAKKKGHVHRGGGHKYTPMRNDILRFLAQEKATDVFFTTMIDLYAIHPDFPGRDDSERLRHQPQKRVEFLENSWADDIDNSRFIPFIQLHEYEAYLFTTPQYFSFFYEQSDKEIEKLQAIAAQFNSPEDINDGQETAPSKRIIKHFPDYQGAKPTVGPQLADLMGLTAIRTKCPHFGAWLSRLERLGKSD